MYRSGLLRFYGVRVPLSKDRQGPGELYFYAFWAHFEGFWRVNNAFGVGYRRG